MFRWNSSNSEGYYDAAQSFATPGTRKRQYNIADKQIIPQNVERGSSLVSGCWDQSGPSSQKQTFPNNIASQSQPNLLVATNSQSQAANHACRIKAKLQDRKWWYNNSPKKTSSRAKHCMPLTVGTYNVLAQNLLEENKYLYEKCEDEQFLTWDYRKDQLMREIQRHKFDILCLQEVYQPHYDDFFLPQLSKLGFKGVYKKRTGNKLDGCATFYRASRLQMVECSLVEYFRNGVACLDRDNVAIVMVLRATATAKDNRPSPTLCVANTHLLYNTKRGDNKLAQLAVLFAEIDRLSFRRCTEDGGIERCPVIVCGDFNLTPFSELYKFIIEGLLFYEGLLARVMSGQDYGAGSNFYMRREFLPVAAGIADTCQFVDELQKRVPSQCATEEEKATIGVKKLSVNRETGAEASDSNSGAAEAAVGACSTGTLSHSLNLVSAYNHFWSSTHNHEVTTIQHGTVDYIMYSVGSKRTNRHRGQMTVDNVVENELYLTATLNVLLKSEMNALENALPNDVNGSDHLLLAAKFLLQNPK